MADKTIHPAVMRHFVADKVPQKPAYVLRHELTQAVRDAHAPLEAMHYKPLSRAFAAFNVEQNLQDYIKFGGSFSDEQHAAMQQQLQELPGQWAWLQRQRACRVALAKRYQAWQ